MKNIKQFFYGIKYKNKNVSFDFLDWINKVLYRWQVDNKYVICGNRWCLYQLTLTEQGFKNCPMCGYKIKR